MRRIMRRWKEWDAEAGKGVGWVGVGGGGASPAHTLKFGFLFQAQSKLTLYSEHPSQTNTVIKSNANNNKQINK